MGLSTGKWHGGFCDLRLCVDMPVYLRFCLSTILTVSRSFSCSCVTGVSRDGLWLKPLEARRVTESP
jgi:hypothetical protein